MKSFIKSEWYIFAMIAIVFVAMAASFLQGMEYSERKLNKTIAAQQEMITSLSTAIELKSEQNKILADNHQDVVDQLESTYETTIKNLQDDLANRASLIASLQLRANKNGSGGRPTAEPSRAEQTMGKEATYQFDAATAERLAEMTIVFDKRSEDHNNLVDYFESLATTLCKKNIQIEGYCP